MNRKKFVALFSIGFLSTALIKANPLNFFTHYRKSNGNESMKVKINPNAVKRENSGKKNG